MKKIIMLILLVLLSFCFSLSFAFALNETNPDNGWNILVNDGVLSQISLGSPSFESKLYYLMHDYSHTKLGSDWFQSNSEQGGTQCWGFAETVMQSLVGTGANNVNRTGGGTIPALRGATSFTYNSFINNGVPQRGATLIRTQATDYFNSSSDSGQGHSMVLLYYNESYVYYIHSWKVNGKTYSNSLTRQTWSEWTSERLTSVNRKIKYIASISDSTFKSKYSDWGASSATTLEFRNVVYPSIYNVNSSTGFSLQGGYVISDVNLVSLDAKIYDSAGNIISQMEDGTLPLSGRTFVISSLDGRGKDMGQKFSKIKTAGTYYWVLTAKDESNRTLTLEMQFNAKTEQTSTSTISKSFACSHTSVTRVTLKEANCIEDGQWGDRCNACNEIIETGSIPALGHDWGGWVVSTAATCTANGVETKTCSRCGASESRSIAAMGHDWGDWAVTAPATCTANGVETKTCSRCGASESRSIAALGHDWGDWAVTTPATCTANGVETRTCKRDSSHTETKTIDRLIPSGTCGDNLTWVLDYHTLTISGTGNMYDYDQGNAPWQAYADQITSIEVGTGVTSIGQYAFYNCTNLTQLTLHEGLEYIVGGAFESCEKLNNVYLPDSVTNIGWWAFGRCKSLDNIRLSPNITVIGIGAFRETAIKTFGFDLPNLTSLGGDSLDGSAVVSVYLPEGLTALYERTFEDCHSLTEVYIPNSVTSIEDGCFTRAENAVIYCSGGSEAYKYAVMNDIPYVLIGCLHNSVTRETLKEANCIEEGQWDERCNICNEIIESGSIPALGHDWGDWVETIAATCTDNGVATRVCQRVSSHTETKTIDRLIPSGTCGDNLTWVLDYHTLTISGTGDMYNYEGYQSPMISYSQYIENVIVENGVTNIGQYAFQQCENLKSVSLPDGITSIGQDAFYNCSSLTSVTIPSSVTSIGKDAFYNCSHIEEIHIDSIESWLSIRYSNQNYSSHPNSSSASVRLFIGNTELKNVVIPNGVTSIGEYTFDCCSGLTSVTIPNSVTSIGISAFYGCSGLTSVTIPGSVTSIGNRAFYNCSGLTRVTIPSSVTSIGKDAFYNCSHIEEIHIDSIESWLSIRYSNQNYSSHPNSSSASVRLFIGNTELKNAVIPDGVTSIGEYMFDCCSGLTSVTIPNSVTSIGISAFYGCRGLTSVVIPNSVTSIGTRAFYNCRGLTSVVIPDSVTSIGNRAFYGCSGLTDVYYTGSSEQWAAIAIQSGNECLTGVTIHCINNVLTLPASLKTVESEAFTGLNHMDAISIPSTVTSIADDAFDADIVIIAPAGSYAETWAKDHGFMVKNP